MDLMYLENIDEFINDNKNIVTYRSLSLTLNIPSNVAKQMLFHYYEKHKEANEETDLSVTYLLSGLIYCENLKQCIQKVCVVRDEELESVKNKFKEISSLHIYSLQKGRLKDLQLLYSTDFDKIKENINQCSKYSAIKCPDSYIKSVKEIPDKPSTSIDKPPLLEQKPILVKEENKENTSRANIVSKPPLAKKSSKDGAILSMFANQNKKIESSKSTNEEKKESKSNSLLKPSNKKSNTPVVKKGSISSFFTKGPLQKPPPKKENKEPIPVKEEINEMNEDSKKESVEVTDEIKEEIEVLEKVEAKRATNNKASKEKSSKKSKAPQKNANKRKSTKSSQKSDSKRRRIIALDSSSSSDSSEEEDEIVLDENPFPSSQSALNVAMLQSDDSDEEVKPTQDSSQASDNVSKTGKNKRRKLVDKTYEDEDGFFVTKKEYALVSDSDDENPIPVPQETPKPKLTSPKIEKPKPKKSSPTESKSKKSSPTKSKSKKSSPTKSKSKKSPVKSKQPVLTNFFKKM